MEIRPGGRWRYELKNRRFSWYADADADPAGTRPSFTGLAQDAGSGLFHPDDQEECKAAFRKAIETRQPFFIRHRVLRPSGSYAMFGSFGSVDCTPDGKPVALVAVAFEYSRGAEISIAEVRARELENLFAEITDIVERRDSHGQFLYVSRGVKRVLGYDQQELVGSNAFDLVHPDDVASARLSLRGLTTTGASTTLTYRVRHKEGHWVWLESKVRAPAISTNGYPEEITAVSRDITSRKRVEEELTTAYARAEAASATKSRFLANMSHELRTPLNAIIGFSDIIRRELFGAVGSARYKEYAQLIHESGGHLLDLINDILDMSKIEAGKLDLRFEAIDLEDLVRSSLKLLEPRASEGKLVLCAEIANERAFVQADRRAIKQIILNLLTNAIKFTPPGGTVTVSIEALSDGAVMQVRDTGIGIAEKDLPRITLPFEQATHDPLLAHGGSGLGLALVQSLVNLHMGTLKIDSVPGAGTCVTVFLPGDPRSRKVA
jgi:PAS domain S-box-containing protein